MANVIRIRRGAGAAVKPSLHNAELAFNETDETLYYGKGGDPNGLTADAVVIPIGGTGMASDALPLPDGPTALAGGLITFSRADHVHPTDTSRAPVDSPTFTGTVLLPPTGSGSLEAATKNYVDG